MAPVLDRRAHPLVRRPRHRPRQPAPLRAPAGEAVSHYSKRTVDIEYRFRFAGSEWGELEGIANRTDFDLTTHAKHSGQDLSLLRPGHQRALHAVRHRAGGRPVAQPDDVPRRRLHRGRGAQHQGRRRQAHRAAARPAARAGQGRGAAAVAATPTCRRRRKALAAELRRSWNVDFDDSGAIGRRYRRQDEIGTPYCVTVDFDTLEDDAVTVRERDTMKQERVGLDGSHGATSPSGSSAADGAARCALVRMAAVPLRARPRLLRRRSAGALARRRARDSAGAASALRRRRPRRADASADAVPRRCPTGVDADPAGQPARRRRRARPWPTSRARSEVGVLDITVTGWRRRRSRSPSRAGTSTTRTKKANPYYVRATVKNVGDDRPRRRSVPLYIVDGDEHAARGDRRSPARSRRARARRSRRSSSPATG